jgi:hypothetical protein
VTEDEVSRYISETFEGVDVVSDSGTSFYFYNPDPNVPPDHNFPFVTLVTNDFNDKFSDLERASVYRLNIGVSKETFRSLFGTSRLPKYGNDGSETGENSGNESDFDFTAVDTVMPHPVYGRMHWVCVLNPGDETFETKVKPLLAEAYAMATGKYDRKAARS